MKWSELPLKPTPRVLRQFAAAWLVFFLLLALRQGLVRGDATAGAVLGAIALVGVVGLVKPSLVRGLFIVATLAAFPIGWLVTHAILGVMFYLVLTPVAVVFRLRRRDALRLRRQPDQTSFWRARDRQPEPGRYLKQF
jgi:hypothetical protein